jgi:hypothetical protein
MKKIRTLIIGLTIAIGLQPGLYAQFSNVDFLKGGVDDAQKLFQEYLTPYGNIFGANLNAGWYNSAKPHKLGGFDLTMTVNTAWAPPAARSFDVSALKLSAVALPPGTMSPTIAGKLTDTRPTIEYFPELGPTNSLKFQLPKGTGVNFLPLPMAQLSIGLPFGTDVSVRYLPTLALGKGGNIGLWGVGGRHSIIQHIPALKRLPILDITAQGGYTKLTTFTNIDYKPSNIDAKVVDLTTDTNQWANQKVEMIASAWTVNLIFSETLPVISFYQGIGFSSSAVDLGLKGFYPFPRLMTDVTDPNFGKMVVEDNTDTHNDVKENPIDIKMKNAKDLRLNAGFRIKLGVLTFHFDYTKANYSIFTGGIGISFR